MSGRKTEFSYDPACETLAEHFLPVAASEQLKKELAQEIQNAVENWIGYERERRLKGMVC